MADLQTLAASNSVTEEKDFVSRPRRARVLKKGRMVFDNGLRSLPCTVRNLSDGGAHLQLSEPHLVPKQFELQIELDGTIVACERRWEDGLDCGVVFVGEVREVSKKSEQILKTSEDALPDEYKSPKRGIDRSSAQSGASDSQRSSAGQSLGKRPTFGRRG